MGNSLEWVKCRKCKGSLFRAFLETGSIVEIKCDRCKELNTITPTAVEMVLVPDGSGGLTQRVARTIVGATE